MFFRSENSCTQQISFHIQQVYVCHVSLVSNRLALNLYCFAKSPVLKQDRSFLFLQLIALLFLPDRLQTQILQNKSPGIHTLCIAVPKPSGKELEMHGSLGAESSDILFILYCCLDRVDTSARGQRAV